MLARRAREAADDRYSQLLCPSLSGFAGEHVYTVHTVFTSCPFLRSSPETIEARCNTDLLQADFRQIRNDLCLRQSAGDSTGPEIDITARVLGEFDIESDVGEMKSATRL